MSTWSTGNHTGPRQRGEFSFTEHDESDGSVRVRVIGELDAAEAPNLQEVLRRLEGEGSDVLLDLSGLSFIDVFGLHLIEEAADAARQGGFGFAIAGSVAMAVRQVFVEAGAAQHLPGAQARLVAPASGQSAHGDVG
jgi:anti-anti-sigma factor